VALFFKLSSKSLHLGISLAAIAAVTACGGGGSSTTPTTAPIVTTTPTSNVTNPSVIAPTATWAKTGNYSVVLKAVGTTTASPLSAALSLVHPENPLAEYVMDSVAAPSDLGYVLQKGSYNGFSKVFYSLVSTAYVDARDGKIRTTLLSANGARPAQLTVSHPTLCPNSAIAPNWADPFATKIALSSPGADGVCGTSDDLAPLLSFSATGTPMLSTQTDIKKRLTYVNSSTTGQPTAWLTTFPNGQVSYEAIAGGVQTTLSVGTTSSPTVAPAFKLIGKSNGTVLYSKNGVLFGLNATASTPSVTQLSTITSPEGWQYGGADANFVYTFINSNTATLGIGTWSMMAVSHTNLATSTFVTGTGSLLLSSANSQRIFATTLDGTATSVIQIALPSGTKTAFVSTSTTALVGLFYAISAQYSGKHIQYAINSSTGDYSSVRVVDDSRNFLYSPPSGLFYGLDGSQFNVGIESYIPDGYVFMTNVSNAGFSGSSIVRFDVNASTTRTIGTVPRAVDIGGTSTEKVFMGPISQSVNFGGTHISRLSNGQLLPTGSGVYTFDLNSANSLTETTLRVR
jgi:hypothetical protein